MKINFKLWNNLSGIIVFLLSAFIYLSTMEPTVSFWDCGEFLTCDSKLEIAHAPGAPLVMLIGRVFSLFAGSDKSHIALLINGLSAIASALTIMFLFWTITWFGRKLSLKTWNGSNPEKIMILSAGFIGAMSYAVSDSFWFSAVEAEVYALSSLFTAIVFWAIIKWEESAEYPGSQRWLMFIAYLFGLSIGVHLLNLLVIPAIVILYYLKTYPVNRNNTIKTLIISAIILCGIVFIIIPVLPKYFSWIEFISVNTLRLHFNSGFIIGIIILAITIGIGLYLSNKRKKIWVYNSLIYFSLLILGMSTYTTTVIRSNDNPPVDMVNPEDPFSLRDYLNREQYVQRPLIYGNSFASTIIDSKKRESYQRFRGRYVPYPLNPKYIYDKNTLMLFPRMSSDREGHAEAYKQWANFKRKSYTRINADGKEEQILLPTFGENFKFFLKYQLGYMYFRYFMWNFAGRQNDIQGHGTVLYGNWISGIPFVDKMVVGPQDKIPSSLKHNPGRNTYFFLPLLLGLLGLVYHYKKDVRNFSVLSLFFFFTGIAIIIFLNEEPVTPRERDYVYVGSFYAFSIWIGIGVIALYQWLKKIERLKSTIALTVSALLSASVPLIMVSENWDDHDRSGRFAVLEYARNYLESCEPNAILFTNADNDTYPLWYAQEVEGIRRDVQIILLPYLSAYWYVDQMRQPSYQKPGVKISLTEDKFIGGKRSYFPIIERIDSTIELGSLMDFVGSEDERAKAQLMDGQKLNYIPSRKLNLSVDKSKILTKPGIRLPLADSIEISLKGQYLRMDQMIMLDILASNKWERPIYFASVKEPLQYGLDKYLQLDGYAYKLVPYKTNPKEISEIGVIDSDSLYNKYIHRFSFASLSNPKVYLDWTHMNTISVISLRQKFARLAESLLSENKTDKAVKVLDKITEMLPNERIPYDFEVLRIANDYLLLGQKTKGEETLKKLKNVTRENLDYYKSLPRKDQNGINYEMRVNLYIMQEILKIAEYHHLDNLSKETVQYWNESGNTLMKG
jgi:hypothetical protein